MSSPAELLGIYLQRFSNEALGESLAPELAEKALEALPELASIRRPDLEGILAAAAAEGVARLISAAELSIQIEGAGPDPSADALAQTIEGIRAALGWICPPPELGLSIEQRQHGASQAIAYLTAIVSGFDAAMAGEEPSPAAIERAERLAEARALWESWTAEPGDPG